MPRVKSVKFLTEICIDFIVESQDIFSEKLPLGLLEDCVDALDSDKPAINPFDELRKLSQILLQICISYNSRFLSIVKFLKISPWIVGGTCQDSKEKGIKRYISTQI